jgi:hypothetical protein
VDGFKRLPKWVELALFVVANVGLGLTVLYLLMALASPAHGIRAGAPSVVLVVGAALLFFRCAISAIRVWIILARSRK